MSGRQFEAPTASSNGDMIERVYRKSAFNVLGRVLLSQGACKLDQAPRRLRPEPYIFLYLLLWMRHLFCKGSRIHVKFLT